MTPRTSPGFAEWMLVAFTLGGVIFLLYQLFQYGSVRQLFPVGLEVAGIDVGGRTREEAEQLISQRYIEAPVVVFHRQQPIDVIPSQVEFTVDFDSMLTQAIFERDQQDFWAGFWGYLWGRPIDVTPVELIATHNDEALRETLRVIADQLDTPALPPQTLSSSMSFQYGAPGIKTNVEASANAFIAALYRHRAREAHLVLDIVESDRPNISLLSTLITNSMQEFEANSGGIGSIFVIDLSTGQEIGYNARVPMSGMSVLKIPILLEAIRILPDFITPEIDAHLHDLAVENDNVSANILLASIAGEDDPSRGAQLVTEAMQALGLTNTFLGCPFDAEERDCQAYQTAANQLQSVAVAPTPYYQTTVEDMAILLSLIYYCAEQDGGALRAIHGNLLTQAKCQRVVGYLQENQIGSLIEQGVPSEVRVAHRHGWQSDTYGDAGIVYSPNGHYVIVEYTHKPGWLAWEVSSPLMADLSQATYNFFNFDDQYLAQR